MAPGTFHRGKVDIEHLSYHPAKPYPYDLEIFSVSDLKRRTRAEAMRRTYSYEFFMLIFVTEGQCAQMVDFEPVHCNIGTLLVLRPGQAHNFGSDENWDGWIILFRPEFLLPTAPLPHELRLAFDLDRLPERLSLKNSELNRAMDCILRMRDDSMIGFSSITDASAVKDNLTANDLTIDVHTLLRYQFYAFVAWLTVVHGKSRIEEPWHSGAWQRFHQFQKLVDQRFAEWSQLREYATHLGCTEKSLTRATTLAVGMNAKAFISKRINLESKRLLAHTDLPVGIIAEKLGFQEATHFSKFFKRETGCTPKEFRARNVDPVPRSGP